MELEASRRDIETLVEIGLWLDSIDRNRYDVLVDWRENGTPFDKYKYRLRAIKNYVEETEMRIQELNERIREVGTSSPEGDKMIAWLRERIMQRSIEIKQLKLRLYKYTRENQALYQQVSQQDLQFDQDESQLVEQQKALENLSRRVDAARESYLSLRASSAYSEAEALEEVANRTRFSGIKKRESLEQALNLYRLSLQYGNEQARLKILQLEKKLE